VTFLTYGSGEDFVLQRQVLTFLQVPSVVTRRVHSETGLGENNGDLLEDDLCLGIRSGRRGQRRPRTSFHRLGQERGRILGMGKKNPILVLASGDDPQFAM